MSTEQDVARALLGTWPTQVNGWGKEGIAAYIHELQARGIDPDAALIAIRTYDPDADFPPSAAKLAQQARKDPSRPTAEEAIRLVQHILAARTKEWRTIWRGDDRAKADEWAMIERAEESHPLVAAFVANQGLSRLRALDLSDGAEPWDRKRFVEAWEAFVQASEGRAVASLVAGRGSGELGRLEPLSVIAGGRRELETGQ